MYCMLSEKKYYISVRSHYEVTHFSSPIEYILFNFLRQPSSAERARSVLCGLDIRFFLNPYYGVLRGTTRPTFYNALENLSNSCLIDLL